MDVISIGVLLEYLYSKFIVTFILCLIGAIVRETMNTVKLDAMNAKRMISSVVLASALMCALADNVKVPFSLYIIICIIAGLWSQTILKLIMNTKFMIIVLRKFATNIKDPLLKSVSTTIDELESEHESDTCNKEDANNSS